MAFGVLAGTCSIIAVVAAKAGTSGESAGSRCPGPDIALAAEAGGRTRIVIKSSCRAGELVSFSYADATFLAVVSAQGQAETVIDCFAGSTSPITIVLEDGTSVVRQPVTDDMAMLSKVAIVWSSSVDLDLHAFEYAASRGTKGHIWSGHALSFAEASAAAEQDGRSHGFLSTASAGSGVGMNAEVYTFVHAPRERSGGVKIAVDFASRGDRAEGDYCAGGRFAELHFKAYILERGRTARQLDLAFASVPCGTDLNESARFNTRLIPELLIRG